MMTVDFSVGKHATAYPNNVLAQKGGKHIYSVVADKDMDNGEILAVNKMTALDTFSAKESTDFAGEIVMQMPNGNYLILVTNPGDACLVYTKPLGAYETPAVLKNENAFYNKQGDIVRAYELAKGDRFEVSAEGFTTTPSAASIGKAVSVSAVTATKRKLVIAS
jgi:hypothetical protein